MRKKKSIRVLLADDHLVVRAGIKEILERGDGIEVVAEADDGEMAQRMIEEQRPEVIVLDIQMPKASGIDVTRWVRSNFPETGVLILTAFDDDPYVLAVLQAGANGYVLKTASPEELTKAIFDVHDGKSVLDSVIAQKLLARVSGSEENIPIETLSDRELEVLDYVAKGYTNKAIGVQLYISARTVQGHLAHIFAKLQVNSRTEAVMRAVSLGWISPEIGSPDG